MTYFSPSSVKRFKRKGFKGHKVNPPKGDKLSDDPFYRLPNKERMKLRRAAREAKDQR